MLLFQHCQGRFGFNLDFVIFFPSVAKHVSKIFKTCPKAREMKCPERWDDPSNPQIFTL